MDERMRESISALMDNEANELELQRVLSQRDQEELKTVWQDYHAIRDVVRNEAPMSFSIDVSDAVSKAIRDDDFDLAQGSDNDEHSLSDGTLASHLSEGEVNGVSSVSDGRASGIQHKRQAEPKNIYSSVKPFMAIAASVVLAVIFTTYSLDSRDLAPVPNVVSAPDSVNDKVQRNTALQEGPVVVANLSERQQRQLSQYLLRHAEHAVRGTQSGFVPLARVASVNSVGI